MMHKPGTNRLPGGPGGRSDVSQSVDIYTPGHGGIVVSEDPVLDRRISFDLQSPSEKHSKHTFRDNNFRHPLL